MKGRTRWAACDNAFCATAVDVAVEKQSAIPTKMRSGVSISVFLNESIFWFFDALHSLPPKVNEFPSQG
jgi:hypothetical protein